jgi:hypothetical protein
VEQRSKADVARKKLVSVFLRKLEYCDNIILTTNRVSNSDDAILSRIHLMLKYHDLDANVRSQIWGHMLHRVHTSKGGAMVTRKEIGRLATTEFNGRQVGFLYTASLETPSTDQLSARLRTWSPSLTL